MPTANEWSLAIAEWATAGRRTGERIYLAVDQDSINRLGSEKWGIDEAFEDFLAAVRRQLGINPTSGWIDTRLTLPKGGALDGGVPECTAFLALLVVCAARRGEKLDDYTGSGTEFFFPWVRKLLGGKPIPTRTGLGELDASPAPEPDLWRKWSRFLERRDYRSVPETTYEGPKANSGYALDQAILTYSCRRTLARLSLYERRALRRWTMLREAHRSTDPPLPHATRHLRALLTDRWDDEHVREAVLGALEGAPSGPRPGRHHLTPIRRRCGQYALKVKPPSGWSRRVSCGANPVIGGEVPLPPDLRLPEFIFQVDAAVQRVTWDPPPFLRFFVALDPLAPSKSGDPELGEEHYLLMPHEELGVLEGARARGECDWDCIAQWKTWVEFEAFRQFVPRIDTASGTLLVRSHGGVLFRGGIRTGEPGRIPRLFAANRGGICSVDGVEQVKVEETGSYFEISEEKIAPLPPLEAGEFHLRFRDVKTRFEIVDWQAVVYEDPEEPAWLH